MKDLKLSGSLETILKVMEGIWTILSLILEYPRGNSITKLGQNGPFLIIQQIEAISKKTYYI